LPRQRHRRWSVSETTQFTIGSDVTFSDRGRGELKFVVLDPVARALTHLVVEAAHRSGAKRLVPIDLVTTAAKEIQLDCTTAEFDALERADETQFLPGARGYSGYGEDQLLSWPYFNLGGGVSGVGLGRRPRPRLVTHDRVPVGEVRVRRGEPVFASDGPIGRVQGLVVDARDHHVTHVLLDEGHLWGHRQMTIPISAVAGVEHGVQLNLTKDEIRDLPPVNIALPEARLTPKDPSR
jgi:hypothetical protein